MGLYLQSLCGHNNHIAGIYSWISPTLFPYVCPSQESRGWRNWRRKGKKSGLILKSYVSLFFHALVQLAEKYKKKHSHSVKKKKKKKKKNSPKGKKKKKKKKKK